MPQSINPASDRHYINSCNIDDHHIFPHFFKRICFEQFRHINNLAVDFRHPVTVIAGNNRSGKTTILLSIACSHFNFKRHNINGDLTRTRWGAIMRFTNSDRQTTDWTYYVSYREGDRHTDNKRGQRKLASSKWNGVAKKESQIGAPTSHRPRGGRVVTLIDIERVMPSRNFSVSVYNKTKSCVTTALNNSKAEYISYVLETPYSVGSLLKSADKEIFSFRNSNEYTSFNTASGEDVLIKMISEIVDTEPNSLILIDEIEIGLHPKIQRRLLDVLYHESRVCKKQFIITTHSSTILSSVEPQSRIFIDNNSGNFRAISQISVNAALSKMDAVSYPLMDVFVEDDIAEKIVMKAVNEIINKGKRGFNNLVNIIVCGSAAKTYNYFEAHRDTYDKKRISCGAACILDGDMQNKRDANGNFQFPAQEGLFFIYSNYAPEKMLLLEYLIIHPNEQLSFHANHSDPHCLFQKIIEAGICSSANDAFNTCWDVFEATVHGGEFFQRLQSFLKERCVHFSPHL